MNGKWNLYANWVYCSSNNNNNHNNNQQTDNLRQNQDRTTLSSINKIVAFFHWMGSLLAANFRPRRRSSLSGCRKLFKRTAKSELSPGLQKGASFRHAILLRFTDNNERSILCRHVPTQLSHAISSSSSQPKKNETKNGAKIVIQLRD